MPGRGDLNMLTPFTYAIDALWGANEAARVKLRIGTHVYEQAVSSGVNLESEATAQGQGLTTITSAAIRADLIDPRFPLEIGSIVEVQTYADPTWHRLRIAERKNLAGVVQMRLETPYE